MNNTTSLFITDPLLDLNPKKDTTILWMQEISAQGGQVFQCEMSDLIYSDGLTQAMASEIPDTLSQPQTANASDGLIPLNVFNYVFMRKDPPVDENYMNALHLLSQAKHEGAKVMNDPDALKIFNEKVFALRFSQWMTDTQVICREDDLLNFKNKYQTIIESNSFIGSGTRLVAPVKIAKGSYIAAGSTVTKDTPGGGSLTIARSKQVTITKWKNNLKSGKK
jgi:glutathione synthase/RimK-type ligase-like ATP-grasp enzyme